MKRSLLMLTLFAWSLLTLSLTGDSAKAQVDPNVRVWHGFSWSPGNVNVTDAGLYIWSVNGNTFTGGLSLYGRGRAISGRFATDGTIDLAEINSATPIKLHGAAKATPAGNFIGMFSVTQGARNLGCVELLRLFQPSILPPDPYYPPDPYINGVTFGGRYFSENTRFVGRLQIAFDPAAHNPPGDHNPPADFTGKIIFGDRSFNFVSTFNDRVALNAYYKFDLVGHASGGIIPCVHVSGELVPAVRPGDASRLQGRYEAIDANGRVLDAGSFDIAAP